MTAVIAQSDVVTAYGWGIDALWDGLMSGNTAIASTDRFSNRGFISNQAALIPDLRVALGESRARAMLNRLLAPLIGKLDPQTPLILATTVCEIEYIERAVAENKPELAAKADPQHLLAHVKQMLGLHGSAMVLSSACASSSAALAQAASMIQRSESSAALVIACDAISEFVYSGFSTLLSLCDTPARPFDAHRCGLSLGEAAAWALVTRDDSPLVNSESVAILGWSNTTDAVHMTAPDRAAGGLSRAISLACKMAQTTSEQITFIAAHGTATLYNDAMESQAFHGAIGRPIPIFSIKGGIGHTLGAAGLTQILVAARAIQRGVVPPTVGLATPDPSAEGWVHNVPMLFDQNKSQTPSRSLRYSEELEMDAGISGSSGYLRDRLGGDIIALSTNSGFGGVNTAVLLGTKKSSAAPASKSAAICAAAWFSTQSCGAISASSSASQQSPPLSATKELTGLIGRPVKYFARMTTEARCCLAAASLAVTAAGWSGGSIGIASAGYDGCIAAGLKYYRDFVAGGLSLGRANLFIYTLPTSAMSEVAIALTLTGPTLHLHEDLQPVKSLVHRAKRLVENGEADGMLAVFSDEHSAVCFAIGAGESIGDFRWDQSVSEMCRALADRVNPR